MSPAKSVSLKRRRPATVAPVAELDALLSDDDATIDDLFPEVAPAPVQVPMHRPLRTCTLCGAKDTLKAHPEHAVCLECATNPQAVKRRLEQQRQMVISQQYQAARAAQVAYDALTGDERERWGAYAILRTRSDNGDDLTDDERRRLRVTTAAYRDANHPKISDAQRAYCLAEEALYWANAANQGRQQQINTQLATLALCLEDLGRKDEADALYPKELTP